MLIKQQKAAQVVKSTSKPKKGLIKQKAVQQAKLGSETKINIHAQ